MKASESTLNTQAWSWAVCAPRVEARVEKRSRIRRRPDVAGYFTFTLVSGLASATLLMGDLFRQRVPFEQLLSFTADHPLTYIVGCCAALLAGLLAVGDV